ncbi:E3 ubiquitin-protein ligase BRE1A [Kappamyces sp. JEL0680]|nr:E3 ubiquitin-protein ligase BRE1A [Kappamyces sp. JEL0680]
MEVDIKKAEQDMARLRRERDSILKTVEQLNGKEAAERKAHDELQTLVENRAARIASLESEVARLKLQALENHDSQSVVALMGKEMEQLYSGWQSLDDQVKKKVFDLQDKEDLLTRLQADKIKLEQKIATLNKQTTTLQNNNMAQKRQMEKQLELIRRLEETERSSAQLLQNLEQQLAAMAPQLNSEKRKVEQQALEVAALRDQLEQIQESYKTTSSLLLEKSQQVEIEKDLTRKAGEQASSMKKKYDTILSTGDAQLQSQVQQYRSCNNDFKDTCLLKCMHTFCNKCITTLYDSRQRKCPTCADPFGREDIRRIFL